MDIACPKCAAAYELDESTVGPKGRKVRCAACGEVWRVMPVETQAALAQEPQTQEQQTQEPDPAAPAPISSESASSYSSDPWPEPESATAIKTESGAAEPEATTTESAAPSTEPGAGEPAAETEPAAPPTPRGARLIKDKTVRASRGGAWRKLADWRVATVAGTTLVLAAGLHEREAVVRLLPQTAKIYAAAGFPVNLRGIEIRNVKSRLVTDNDEPVLVVDGDLVNVSDRRVDVPRLHFSLLGADGRQIYVWSAQADRSNLQPGETLNFRRRLAAPPGEAKNVSVRFITRSDITAGIK